MPKPNIMTQDLYSKLVTLLMVTFSFAFSAVGQDRAMVGQDKVMKGEFVLTSDMGVERALAQCSGLKNLLDANGTRNCVSVPAAVQIKTTDPATVCLFKLSSMAGQPRQVEIANLRDSFPSSLAAAASACAGIQAFPNYAGEWLVLPDDDGV